MNFVDIISRRRDGTPHTQEELRAIAFAAAHGSVPDYQLAAWLMAAFLNPLSKQETAWLTVAMAESGGKIDLTGLPKPWVDKHSTGGVGDKTTISLLPILAACGLTVVKMSGRGLGITGGTVDKLASIPGFRLDLSPGEMKEQASHIGLALTGQSPDLAPADKALYALRDVTATVSSIPLIVSSILSKKIAGGAETILLDVKCGSGAFMESKAEAEELAHWLVEIGTLCGLKVTAELSDMEFPLGSAVGNALEVKEALAVLHPNGVQGPSQSYLELVKRFAVECLVVSGKLPKAEATKSVENCLATGRALSKAKKWIAAQGGNSEVVDEPSLLPQAQTKLSVTYEGADASLAGFHAATIGQAVIELGGGRKTKDDDIDLSVGIELTASPGDQISTGTQLAIVHARSMSEAEIARDSIFESVRTA